MELSEDRDFSRGRVLFVDDDEPTRKAFRRLVSAHGFRIDLADGAHEAIRMAQRRAYPVVVTDLRMPRMNGLALVERLRATHPSTSFLVTTGLPNIDVQRVTDTEGVVAVLTKPWDIGEVLATLARAFEMHAATDETSWPSLLLIEDNPGDVDLVEELLLETGEWPRHFTTLRVATTLEEGVGILHDGDVDVVLADLGLPDASGLDSVRRIGSASPDAAIIVLTGLDDEQLGLRAVQLGAEDYLPKAGIDGVRLTRAIRFAFERKKASRRLAHLALRDHLTGLGNRRAFMARAEHAMAMARRTEGRFAVVFLDLDDFKRINDAFGHDTGDDVLREIANRLRSGVRAGDLVARFGGDEFAVLMENPGDEGQLEQVVYRLVREIGRPVSLSDAAVDVSASLGVAVFPDAADSIERLLACADTASYGAKKRTGTSCEFFVPRTLSGRPVRGQLHVELRRALERREFLVHYQPIYDLRGQPRAVGLEALIRWQMDDGTLVPPGEFIPVLEATGLIIDVGRWVTETACRHAFALFRAGFDLKVNANVSVVQFEQHDFVESVESTLRGIGLPPDRLALEITESIFMRDTSGVTRTLDGLQRLGVKLAIDDFGTGYSSLSYLSRLNVHSLKIDRSFVREASSHVRRESIVRTIVDLGNRLGLDVVAEGVESPDQLDLLRSCGCHLAQGFLLGRPAPYAEGVPPEGAARLPVTRARRVVGG